MLHHPHRGDYSFVQALLLACTAAVFVIAPLLTGQPRTMAHPPTLDSSLARPLHAHALPGPAEGSA